MKMTPKSCSCTQCRRGKSIRAQKILMKKQERSFRHMTKAALRKGSEDVMVAPYGNYTD